MCINNTISNYVRQKQMELQEEMDESTITIENFATPLSVMDRSNRQEKPVRT